ncbi:hypothetical protein [Tardiphaga sp.]|jgi:hypothetical protein|uniref:hypothetical protein n=1 Tax=Tardiphaga sp. TaxID=1926292 RepID=UPI0037DA76E8
MIEVEAPDGSIVEFPDGTDRGVMAQAMAKRFGAPTAPDLASVSAAAQRDLVQQPGAMEARNAADLAKLAPTPAAPVGFMDKLRSLVTATPANDATALAEPAVMATINDQGAYLARGARKGVANIVGLPVDIVNAVMGVAGAPVSQTPFGGSKSIDNALGGFGAIPEVRPPSTTLERALTRIGEEIGAAALPVGAAVQAGKMGAQAARELSPLLRTFVEPAAINPSRFVRKEMNTALAAGTGAAAAGEVSHLAGAKEGSAAHNTLDILGALGGAGVLGAARVVGKPLSDISQVLTAGRRESFANQNVTDAVVDRLANSAEILPRTIGQPIDTQPLVDAIMGGRRVDTTIPGFKESVADRTGDSGLAALEYGRQSGPNAGKFIERRTDNTAAVDNAMERLAPDGNPADLRSELSLERDRRLTDASVQTANATDDFERATQALRPVMTAEGRGANIRQALEVASEGARDILRRAWEPINNSGTQVDMAPLDQAFDRVRNGMSTAEARRFQPGEANIPGELSGQVPIDPPRMDANGQPITEAITQPINEVTGLRSALTDAAREAMTNGRTNEARIIEQHVTALDNYLDNAVPPELRQSYDQARAATVDFHDRFTRPQTAIAQTLDRQQGLYRQPDSAVPGKFVQSDEGRIADFQALMRETGNDDRVVSAVRDQILHDVRDRGLLDRPDQLRDYLTRYNTVLSDPRFNATRGELDNAAGLRRTLDNATTAETAMQRELGTAERPGTSTVGKYLQYGDERSQDALKGVIASKNPGAAMDEMLNFVGNAPDAVAGARKSFWDLMQSKVRSNGETTRTMDGKQPVLPNRLQNFLDDPANRAVAERLYRDEPQHLQNVEKIAGELQNVDLRSRGKAPNTSGTTQGISNVLTPETIQSRFYAYKRGQTSLGFMLTALGSVAARRAVRGAQGEAIEKLLDKALLDPDLAAELLKNGNPANRAALARTAKAYLGNEVSTLADILTAAPDDPVRDAVMKKDVRYGR